MSLHDLAELIRSELGFCARVECSSSGVKIVGGWKYVEADGLHVFQGKFEVLRDEDNYSILLPFGQTFQETRCELDRDVLTIPRSHFDGF